MLPKCSLSSIFSSKIRLAAIALFFSFSYAVAEEGMWMPDEKGDLPPEIERATIMFSDFCTGVFVSPEGLLLTNHHCALDAIHLLSTAKKNYVENGFAAQLRKDEIPVPGLNIKRLLYSRELTDRIASATSGIEREEGRQSIIKNLIRTVCDSVAGDSPFLFASIEGYYEQTRYFLNVYEVFHDVRLVLAPPHALGAFGGEHDNWMWPRCAADFAVLRVYASDNSPAYFSPKNKPLTVRDYASISMQGYRLADSVMTVGFPGETYRYSTSWEAEAIRDCTMAPMIEVRQQILDCWRDAMEKNPHIKFAYSSKYSECANAYKYATGMTLWMDSLNVVGQKKTQEQRLLEWAGQDSLSRAPYRDALFSIRDKIADNRAAQAAAAYLLEAFMGGSEMVGHILKLKTFGLSDSEIARFYSLYDIELDKQLLKKMLRLAEERVPVEHLPSVYEVIREHHDGDVDAYVESAFRQSLFCSEKRLKKALRQKDPWDKMEQDPLYKLAYSVRITCYAMFSTLEEYNHNLAREKRVLFDGWREFLGDEVLYSDANFTMRKSFGAVMGFPGDQYFTTPRDLLAKNVTMKREYFLSPSLKSLFEKPEAADLRLCFISDNDITGGNSGSPVFNSKGQLIGLAFDGNWEGLSGDLLFGNQQRAVHVDIRYVLFLICEWAKAEALYKEMVKD